MTDVPLVSCVMPTRDRRTFARQAIRYFLHQDYPAKELIVLDDGDDAIDDLSCGDERIRYVRLPGRNVMVLAPPDARLADMDGVILQAADVAAGTVRALGDADLRRALAARASDYCNDHSWDRVARRHLALWTALEAT